MLPLLDHLRAHGHDPSVMVRHFGLSTEVFDTSDLWIPVALAERMWEFAADAYEDPNLGLHVAANVDPASYGVLGYLAVYSQTLYAALARVAKYHRTISSLSHYQLEVTRNYGRFYSVTGLARTSRQMEEFCLGAIVSCTRKLCEKDLVVRRACFRSQRPPAADEHRALICEDLEFDSARTFIELPLEALQTPMKHADPQLVQILEAAADERMHPTMDGELCTQVRAHISARLSAGMRAPCEAVAAELGVSARSLRRHLSEQGHTFRAIYEDVITQMADQLLLDPEVPLEEVVKRLQFSDLRGLAGATQRWFGMTPQQYRKLTDVGSG